MIRDYKPKDTDAVVKVWKAASAVAQPFLANDFIADEAEHPPHYLPHPRSDPRARAGQRSGRLHRYNR